MPFLCVLVACANKCFFFISVNVCQQPVPTISFQRPKNFDAKRNGQGLLLVIIYEIICGNCIEKWCIWPYIHDILCAKRSMQYFMIIYLKNARARLDRVLREGTVLVCARLGLRPGAACGLGASPAGGRLTRVLERVEAWCKRNCIRNSSLLNGGCLTPNFTTKIINKL